MDALASNTAKLSNSSGPLYDDISHYRSLVGGLKYLTITRSNISFSINKVALYMDAPRLDHWQTLKHMLSYHTAITD